MSTTVGFEPHDVFYVPERQRLTYSRIEAAESTEHLALYHGFKEAVFDEPRMFDFAEGILRHERFRGGDAMRWSSGEPYAWSEVRGLLESLVAAGVLTRLEGGAASATAAATAAAAAARPSAVRPERLRAYVDSLATEDGSERSAPLRSPFPLQRPYEYYPGLETRTVWDRGRFPWVPALERAYPAILAELNEVVRQKVGFRKVWDPLIQTGDWAAYPLFVYGKKNEANCARCPNTVKALQAIPGVGGIMCFSAFAPGTRIGAHCGITNARLRAHLALKIPNGCSIRVGRDRLSWTPGQCLVIDDSFDHDARNDSDEPRFVLMFDFPHPDLVGEEIEMLAEIEASLSAGYVADFESWADRIPDWI